MPSDEGKKKAKPEEPAQVGRDLVQDVINLAFLLILVGIFFLDVIVHGQVFFAGDIMNVYTPWQKYNQEALAAGRMPLWCDDLFMGFPLFAESQGALFYLPTRLVYLLVPAAHAFSYDVLLHFLLAGWFQYLFARTLRLSPAASLLSAVAFAFSGMFLSLPINFTIFRSIVWIPLIFMFLTLGARRHSLIFPLMAALSMVLQMMGGSLQVTAITILALVPYVVFLILSPGEGKKQDMVPLLQFILMLMLAGGLYLFQLFPTWELKLHAWRGVRGDYSVASDFSFPPLHFIDAILPTFFGSWSDRSLLPVEAAANFFPYIGLAPLLLILPGLFSGKRGVPVLLILAVLFISLAIGKYGVTFPIVYSIVPLFDQFRAPDRFWFIAVFAGTLLGGYGLQALMTDAESEKPKLTQVTVGAIGLVLLLGALFVAAALYVPVVRQIWRTVIDFTFAVPLAGIRDKIAAASYASWQTHVTLGILHALAVLAMFHFTIALFGKKGRSGALAGMLVLITVIDLYVMSFSVPALHTTGKEFFTVPPRSAQVLRRDGEPNRFYSFLKTYYAREVFKFNGSDDTIWYNGGGSNDINDYVALREALAPNIFMHWGLTSSNGFASLFLDRYLTLESAAGEQMLPLLQGAPSQAETSPDWADRPLLVDLMASRYVLTPIEFEPTERFSLVDDGPMKVYLNRKALPRAWVARPQTILGETPASLQALAKAEIDPRTILILDPLPRAPITFPQGAEGDASAVIAPTGGAGEGSRRGGAVRDEQVLIEVLSPQPAYLVLADTYYPGWYAEIDGAPVETIYRAFGYFRAIEITEGKHVVRFYYDPPSFDKGVKVSGAILATFILLLLVQVLFFSRAKPRKKDE